MSAHEGHSSATAVEGARAVLGALHLIRSGRDRRTATFHRVIGVRQVVQAGVLARAGSGNAHTVGAAIDAAHAVTMLPLLVAPAPWRRVALRQVVLATAFAIAEVALVGTGRRH
ncbi:hypothetical protein ACLBWP_14665 [Microbacterium sp. M1A1_1b]